LNAQEKYFQVNYGDYLQIFQKVVQASKRHGRKGIHDDSDSEDRMDCTDDYCEKGEYSDDAYGSDTFSSDEESNTDAVDMAKGADEGEK
jgi:hypothetical protein